MGIDGRLDIERQEGLLKRYIPGVDRYWLRCVLFHNVQDRSSTYTDGLGITTPSNVFEQQIRFLSRRYHAISFSTLMSALKEGERLPRKALLVTFDDSYASLATVAAEICAKYHVPLTCFINGGFIDNGDLSLDNLLCHAANRLGVKDLCARLQQKTQSLLQGRPSWDAVKQQLLLLPPRRRDALGHEVAALIGATRAELAHEAGLYLSSTQLRELSDHGCEIGNHTLSHIHCRSLYVGDLEAEVFGNQRRLETITGRAVRTFSVPYGSSKDLTPDLIGALRRSGHGTAFLSESLPNTVNTSAFRLSRISSRAKSATQTVLEIELLPRLRAVRNRLIRWTEALNL